jgi:hypothetical protein
MGGLVGKCDGEVYNGAGACRVVAIFEFPEEDLPPATAGADGDAPRC